VDDPKKSDVETAYDRVADEYVRRIFDELPAQAPRPATAWSIAASVQGVAAGVRHGLWPGHVARYLCERGAQGQHVALSEFDPDSSAGALDHRGRTVHAADLRSAPHTSNGATCPGPQPMSHAGPTPWTLAANRSSSCRSRGLCCNSSKMRRTYSSATRRSSLNVAFLGSSTCSDRSRVGILVPSASAALLY